TTFQEQTETIARYRADYLETLSPQTNERFRSLRAKKSCDRLQSEPHRLSTLHPERRQKMSPRRGRSSAGQTQLRIRQKELREDQKLARLVRSNHRLTPDR